MLVACRGWGKPQHITLKEVTINLTSQHKGSYKIYSNDIFKVLNKSNIQNILSCKKYHLKIERNFTYE